MSDRWTGWKSFPDDYYGEYIQAPMGPGLYEVCRSSTREQVAFGCTRNVADLADRDTVGCAIRGQPDPRAPRGGDAALRFRACLK